jgi:hypothetical protein
MNCEVATDNNGIQAMCYYYKANDQIPLGNPGRYQVGDYDPKGNWHTETMYSNADDAAARVNYLNGSTGGASKVRKR